MNLTNGNQGNDSALSVNLEDAITEWPWLIK
jgi:hypothetical protein